MKKTILGVILTLCILISSCGNDRFKRYRAASVNVIDKKINAEQAEYYRQLKELKDSFDVAVEKSARGERSTPYEMYDSMSYAEKLQNGGLHFQLPDYYLPSAMNPRWIEVNEDYIVFEDREKKEVKKFRIKSIDTQEGIKNADWLISIDDSEIEQAVLTEGVLHLKSGIDGHFDYTYTFAQQ
jgi:hypothetical protein